MIRAFRTWPLISGLALLACSLSNAQAAAPSIFFTDLQSGPNSGGENVSGYAGAYVTIYGNNFGSSQGTSTVTLNGANCLRVVSWGTSWRWYQKIIVQLGSNCSTGLFSVTVNGLASKAATTTLNAATTSNAQFTVRTGNIRCVSANGSDSNSGSFSGGCWATMQHAADTMGAGDITYVRDGVSETNVGAYGAVLNIMSSGSAGNPKALVTYPGATATVGSATGNQSYSIRTPNIGPFHDWVIAGLTVRSGDIGVEVSGGSQGFRVVALDASCPNAIGTFQGSCMDTATGANNIQYIGNYDHDNAQVNSSGSTKGFHNMYFSTDGNHIVASWNEIAGDTGRNLCNGGVCNACRGIQFHSSPSGTGSDGYNQYDLHVHDNYIHDVHCDGINFATIDPSKGPVEAYNNLIVHAGTGVLTGDTSSYDGIYVQDFANAGSPGAGPVQIYNNTVYDSGDAGNGAGGYISNDGLANITMVLRNNLVYSTGTPYFQSNATLANISGSNNLWFGKGNGPSQTTANVNADPLFVSATARNFHLQAGSPAINTGTNSSPAATQDLDGIVRPQGSANDIGVYEYIGGSTQTSACDLNGDGSVNSTDVQVALSQATGASSCTNADLQNNGTCNVVDVQRVINASLGQSCRVGP